MVTNCGSGGGRWSSWKYGVSGKNPFVTAKKNITRQTLAFGNAFRKVLNYFSIWSTHEGHKIIRFMRTLRNNTKDSRSKRSLRARGNPQSWPRPLLSSWAHWQTFPKIRRLRRPGPTLKVQNPIVQGTTSVGSRSSVLLYKPSPLYFFEKLHGWPRVSCGNEVFD